MMELDGDVELMFVAAEPVGRMSLNVHLSSVYNRIPLPTELEKAIDDIWDRKLKDNPRLWNGTKFRIHSVKCENSNVIFNLGITNYKEFIGTNWSPNAGRILQLGSEGYGNSHAHMSDALGVGSIVITSDDRVLLLRRSQHCAEAVGLLDIPGGHPEPKELVGPVDASAIDVEAMDAASVVQEIFDSTLREICDEVNVPLDTLSDPRLLGIARNTTSAGRPSSEYIVRCSLSWPEVLALYRKGDHIEADESTNLTSVALQDVATLQYKQPDLWNDLAPSAKGCLTLYRLLCADMR